ncbi:hypothetical protein [Actinomadura bangladeshensis]|uniref:Uncharacterized protein n=1 Tax=Actinomadura bangladeshensis TaxID=453573 RepID=A0A6L9QSN4_9ACTN|nr:hypothetical protein [Actinomadura bangladeshensis]NEA28509.1 hypothetical protein [Actinomadura bangladeshensis]
MAWPDGVGRRPELFGGTAGVWAATSDAMHHWTGTSWSRADVPGGLVKGLVGAHQ